MPRSALRRLVVTSAGLLVAALGVATPAHADVVDPNMLLVNDGVSYESCNDVPYSLKPLSDWGSAQSHALGNVYGTYNYEVTLKVIAPDGTEGTTRTVHRSADDLHQYGDDTGAFFLCDGAGTYVVQASGYWCWINYNPSANPDKCQTVAFQKSFSLRSAKTKTTLKGGSKTYRLSNRPFKFKASVKVERSTGMFGLADARMKLEYLKGGRWVTYDTNYTNTKGGVTFNVKFAGTGAFKFRASVQSDDYYDKSKSSQVAIHVTH
jgi:hypothetical protein